MTEEKKEERMSRATEAAEGAGTHEPRRGASIRRASRLHASHPLDRLGRWNGTTFEPVEPRSITGGTLRVMSHGWAPGLGPVVDASDRFLRVWDPEATTADGTRYDGWYRPLADALLRHDPSSTVLAFTWIDESATSASKLSAGRSQLRTTAAGNALAMALQQAMADPAPAVHFFGYSHGAKVVSVAAALMPDPPVQVTLFDSPENTLPVLGGALNDLSSYLRALPIGSGHGKTFVDNYPSKFGIRYGRDPGLGEIVDVMLDPLHYPLDDEASEHSYAWRWYLESARNMSRGVGFAWSPTGARPTEPPGHQLQHPEADEAADPLTLVPATKPARGRRLAETISERAARGERGQISTDQPIRRGLFWRRSGDQIATINIRWLRGPADASLVFSLNGAERWRSTRGWSDEDARHGVIPIGSLKSGVGVYEMRLDATEPAAVEITPGTVHARPVSILVEYRSWLRTLATVSPIAVAAVTSLLRRRSRGA